MLTQLALLKYLLSLTIMSMIAGTTSYNSGISKYSLPTLTEHQIPQHSNQLVTVCPLFPNTWDVSYTGPGNMCLCTCYFAPSFSSICLTAYLLTSAEHQPSLQAVHQPLLLGKHQLLLSVEYHSLLLAEYHPLLSAEYKPLLLAESCQLLSAEYKPCLSDKSQFLAKYHAAYLGEWTKMTKYICQLLDFITSLEMSKILQLPHMRHRIMLHSTLSFGELWSHCSLQLKVRYRIRLIIWHIYQGLLRNMIRKHDFQIIGYQHKGSYVQFINYLGLMHSFDHSNPFQKGKKEFFQSRPFESSNIQRMKGGGRVAFACMLGSKLNSHLVYPTKKLDESQQFVFKLYIQEHTIDKVIKDNPDYVITSLPVKELLHCVSRDDLKLISRLHSIKHGNNTLKVKLQDSFRDHDCLNCEPFFTVFAPVLTAYQIKKRKTLQRQIQRMKLRDTISAQLTNLCADADTKKEQKSCNFPPPPNGKNLLGKIIRDFCADTQPDRFEEAGCSVCLQLTVITKMKCRKDVPVDWNILKRENVAVKERQFGQSVIGISEPIIQKNLEYVCLDCIEQLKIGKMPLKAAANNLWIGDVPKELQNMTFAEQMLISRIRHNRCVVRVASGRGKMVANCIMFANPTAKIYKALPPSRKDLSEVIAFVF